jgi:two-component system, NarL family, response regulator NreC
MQTIKLAVIDENKHLSTYVSMLLKTDAQINVAVDIENFDKLFQYLKGASVDIVILSNRLFGESNSLHRLTANYPTIKIIAWLHNDTDVNLVELIIHGVKSFFDQRHYWDDGDFSKAIRLVNDGGIYMTEYSANIIQRYLLKTYTLLKPPPVSHQERALIKMIMDGLTSKQIGEKLYKSHRTVDDMREKLYRKFEVTNKVELIRVAMQFGLQKE